MHDCLEVEILRDRCAMLEAEVRRLTEERDEATAGFIRRTHAANEHAAEHHRLLCDCGARTQELLGEKQASERARALLGELAAAAEFALKISTYAGGPMTEGGYARLALEKVLRRAEAEAGERSEG